jgi:hypothetical protein
LIIDYYQRLQAAVFEKLRLKALHINRKIRNSQLFQGPVFLKILNSQRAIKKAADFSTASGL